MQERIGEVGKTLPRLTGGNWPHSLKSWSVFDLTCAASMPVNNDSDFAKALAYDQRVNKWLSNAMRKTIHESRT